MKLREQYKIAFDTAYSTLNEGQKNAVDAVEGPVLVIAGPGTGKTQILAVRIGKILEQTDTLPENILCLTYTDAGTIAMRKRLSDFIGPDAYRVHIYTFHAFCNHIIQSHSDYFGKRELEQISELENVNYIEEILNGLNINHPLKKFKGDLSYDTKKLQNLFQIMKEEDWSSEKISREIDNYLNDLPNRNEYIYKRANAKTGVRVGDVKQNDINKEKEKMETLRAAANLFPIYENKMTANGRYDYSDMILWVVKAFKENETILRTYQEQYLYFLVDEFQDTNGAQFEILQQLINYWEVPNVFAVGDDDQSIYEFQGARVKNIMDFYHAYENNIDVVVLTENYRSTQPILDTAKVVIDNNKERLTHLIEGLNKNLISANTERKIFFIQPAIEEYENPAQEFAGILMQVEQLQKNNFPLHEIAVIYHRHKQAENLIQLFEKRKIPYNVKKKINILDLPLVENILNFFRYLEMESKFPHKGEHFLFMMMHYPYFGIHPHDIAYIAAYLSNKKTGTTWRTTISDIKILCEIKLKDVDAIIKFEKTITHWLTEMHNITLQMLFEKVINESGLLKNIILDSEREWLLEVITTLFDHIKTESIKTPRLSITQFLETLHQMEIHSLQLPLNKNISNEHGVNFITAHSAKGLEFESVFMLGSTKDKWERARSNNFNYGLPDTLTNTKDATGIESLRRLFFVAMTRAKQNLHISFSKTKEDGKEAEHTQFIAEVMNGTEIKIEEKEIPSSIMIEYAIASLTETEKPKIDLFDKQFIQNKIDGYILSASALNKYLDCPLKFYFENIIKIPQAKNDSMSFGTAVHYALRKIFERMKEDPYKQFPQVDIVLKDFEYEMQRNKDSFTEKQFENRILMGRKLLPEYYNQYSNSWNKIVVTEFPLRNIVFDHIPITGVFDKIEFDGNNVNVIDYKTGSVTYARDKLKAPDDKNPIGGDYWRQIMFYKILLDNYKSKNWKMISGEIDFLEKDPAKNQFIKHKFYLEAGEIETVKQQIKETYQNIKDMKFIEGCGEKDCEWCNFVRENYKNK
ncbi:MAG: ATP-dependent helicase [Fimbriimonadaceae bacterium]|nr:ATP-dependent helicase [Chitinophagales bacterium]